MLVMVNLRSLSSFRAIAATWSLPQSNHAQLLIAVILALRRWGGGEVDVGRAK